MAMVTILFGNETIGSHTLVHVPFSFGRDPKCDVPIDNAALSRTHCRISHMGGMFHIEDMRSSNGTFLNGEKVDGAPLKDGDQIRIGKYVLVFHQAPGEGPPVAKGFSAAKAPEAAAEPAAAASAKGAGFPDIGQTFQLDANALQQQAAVGTHRAIDVAKAAGGEKKSGAGLYAIIGLLAVIVLGLAAAVVYLVTKGG